jgi:hypothetical protein
MEWKALSNKSENNGKDREDNDEENPFFIEGEWTMAMESFTL